jgi:hypothetical protein
MALRRAPEALIRQIEPISALNGCVQVISLAHKQIRLRGGLQWNMGVTIKKPISGENFFYGMPSRGC